MNYQGSKRRIAKQIIDKCIEFAPDPRIWIEPFVGGANVIDKVSANYTRVGYDLSQPLITLFLAFKAGWLPPDAVSEKEYLDIRDNPQNYSEELYAFVGFTCSWGGKWWGGYARSGNRNFAREGRDNLLKQLSKLDGIELLCADYCNIELPEEPAIIYCDPPYKNTLNYNSTKSKFNSDEFWAWAAQCTADGHYVFVSEYEAPDDWETVLEIPIKSVMRLGKSKTAIEKLFYKPRSNALSKSMGAPNAQDFLHGR
jgi:DNA adenine methylase